jgi:hypothetical protein
VLLTAQLIFYFFAWVGNKAEGKSDRWKILYLPTFLVNSNIAALKGLYKYLYNLQTNKWDRVQRRSGNKAEV